MPAKFITSIYILLFLLSGFVVTAQQDPEIQSVYQAELPVVFTGIQAYGLDPAQKLVLPAMEDAFLMQISSIDRHFLNGTEKEYLIKDTARAEIKRLLSQIHAKTNELSLGLINETLDINTRIDKERYLEKLRRLYKGFSPDQLDEPPRQLPVKIVDTEPETGIALYVDISVRNLEGYFKVLVELRGGGKTYTSSFAMGPDELDYFARSCADEVVPFLMGIEPCSILVETSDDASVYLNGRFSGRGNVEMLYLYPGTYDILVDAVGYDWNDTSVILSSGEERFVSLIPESLDLRQIAFNGQGAEVYLDGEYAGETPLTLSIHEEMFLAELRNEGFVSVRLYLNIFEGESYEPAFIPLDQWQRDEIELKRNEFYVSFGVFVFSLAIPIVMNGLHENNRLEFAGLEKKNLTLATERLEEYQMWNDIWYYSYIGSIGLSGGILTYALFDLFEYMDVYKKYNGI